MWSWARLLPEVWPASLGPVARLSPTTSLAAESRVAVYDQAGVGLSAGLPRQPLRMRQPPMRWLSVGS